MQEPLPSIKFRGELMDDPTLMDLFGSLSREMGSFRQEMKDGFGAVNQRLDRIDATLGHHGKQLAAGARAIAGFNEWVGKADADASGAATSRCPATSGCAANGVANGCAPSPPSKSARTNHPRTNRARL